MVPAPSLGLGYLCQGASGGENQVGFNFNVVIEDTYFSNDFLFYKVFYLTWIENKNKNSKMCIDILTLVLLQLSVWSRVSNASEFYLRAIAGPVISAQFRTNPRNTRTLTHNSAQLRVKKFRLEILLSSIHFIFSYIFV